MLINDLTVPKSCSFYSLLWYPLHMCIMYGLFSGDWNQSVPLIEFQLWPHTVIKWPPRMNSPLGCIYPHEPHADWVKPVSAPAPKNLESFPVIISYYIFSCICHVTHATPFGWYIIIINIIIIINYKWQLCANCNAAEWRVKIITLSTQIPGDNVHYTLHTSPNPNYSCGVIYRWTLDASQIYFRGAYQNITRRLCVLSNTKIYHQALNIFFIHPAFLRHC